MRVRQSYGGVNISQEIRVNGSKRSHLGHGTTLSKMRSLRRLDRLLFWYCPTPLGTSAAGTRATCRGRQYGTDVQQPPLSLLRR